MARAGKGTPLDVAGELFKMMAGVDLVSVAYQGESPAIPDLLSGQMQIMFGVVRASLGHITSGRLRALAVTTAARQQVLPEVPAMNEFLPGFEAVGWYGIAAPKIRPRTSSNSSTKGSTRRSAIPRSKPGSPNWGSVPAAARRASSPLSLPPKPRSGPKS